MISMEFQKDLKKLHTKIFIVLGIFQMAGSQSLGPTKEKRIGKTFEMDKIGEPEIETR